MVGKIVFQVLVPIEQIFVRKALITDMLSPIFGGEERNVLSIWSGMSLSRALVYPKRRP